MEWKLILISTWEEMLHRESCSGIDNIYHVSDRSSGLFQSKDLFDGSKSFTSVAQSSACYIVMKERTSGLP